MAAVRPDSVEPPKGSIRDSEPGAERCGVVPDPSWTPRLLVLVLRRGEYLRPLLGQEFLVQGVDRGRDPGIVVRQAIPLAERAVGAVVFLEEVTVAEWRGVREEDTEAFR